MGTNLWENPSRLQHWDHTSLPPHSLSRDCHPSGRLNVTLFFVSSAALCIVCLLMLSPSTLNPLISSFASPIHSSPLFVLHAAEVAYSLCWYALFWGTPWPPGASPARWSWRRGSTAPLASSWSAWRSRRYATSRPAASGVQFRVHQPPLPGVHGWWWWRRANLRRFWSPPAAAPMTASSTPESTRWAFLAFLSPQKGLFIFVNLCNHLFLFFYVSFNW